MHRQDMTGMNALLDSCVGEIRAHMAVLESDPENPSFDTTDRMVKSGLFPVSVGSRH